MEVQSLVVAVAAMIGLGLMLSAVLAAANARLYVYENPRIGQVEEILPASNCGACGAPGCRAFAESLVAGEEAPGNCTVSSEEAREAIAGLLGVDVGGAEKRVARLACAGGTNVARQRASYEGLQTCRAANLVAGGGKGCAWGCLGWADCQVVCDLGAISMDPFSLPVVNNALCTACGDCVEICPKGLFSLHPVSHRLWVACANESFGDEAEAECVVACNACGRCVADAPPGMVSMAGNLAVVDYSREAPATAEIIQRCPTGAIVWLDSQDGVIRGKQAKRIVRQTSLAPG